MTPVAAASRPETIRIGLHTGNVLWYLAHLNRTPSEVVVELVQNALDEDAKHIHIFIDARRASLIAYDDGNGATVEEIGRVWEKVGLSAKKGKAGKTGEKGIAKLSGFSIAEKYVFTTRPLLMKGSSYFSIMLKRS